jgi:hypothetical protein
MTFCLFGRAKMSKYEPQWKHLQAGESPALRLSFDEIKKIPGFGIDHSFPTRKKEAAEKTGEKEQQHGNRTAIHLKTTVEPAAAVRQAHGIDREMAALLESSGMRQSRRKCCSISRRRSCARDQSSF